MTGYGLRVAIRDLLGHFWSESFGQIYPTLGELERLGNVKRRGSKRTGASMFSLTRSRSSRRLELAGRV
jgi:DNA-binding PadR family transcriptional regulator